MVNLDYGMDDPRRSRAAPGPVWNPAAPATPGEAAWAQPWQPGTYTSKPQDGTGVWSGQHDQSYRWYEPDVRETYEKQPQIAYQGFLGFGFGDRERPLLDYARSQYNTAYAAAMRGQEASSAIATGGITPPNTGATWTDYLTPDLVMQIRQGFQMQSATNRGVTNTFMPNGRWAGG